MSRSSARRNATLAGALVSAAVCLLMASCWTMGAAFNAAMTKPAGTNEATPQGAAAPAAQTPAAAPAAQAPATQGAMPASGGSAASQYQFNAFYGGMWSMGWFGYSDSNYKPGQGTVWTFSGSGNGSSKEVQFERALLKVNDDNSAWWRFKLNDGKTDILYEFLVGSDGTAKRVRFKDPDTGAVSEFVPDASGRQAPQADAAPRTRADIAAYLVDRQQVMVKGGAFNADHYLYPDAKRGGKSEFWLSDSVPGYMIKSVNTAKDGKTSTGELTKIETGITTTLSSY